jgi:glutamate transport system permease protein
LSVVFGHLDVFVEGMRTTVSLTVLAFALAFVIGTVVAAFRVSPIPPLRWAGALYVETWRNTPLTVLMVLFFFGLTKVGIRYGAFTTAAIVLAGYTGAFMTETIRSGINSVAHGQGEAARSIGLTYPQLMTAVVLPQAIRTVIAPIGSLFIALTKNSSIAAVISVNELVYNTDRLSDDTARPVPVFLGAAVAYLLITTSAGVVFGILERRVAIRR